jgi:hypothetical protein
LKQANYTCTSVQPYSYDYPVSSAGAMVLNNSASSSAATDGFKKSANFSFIVKNRHQFVAVLEVAELFCTFVQNTAIGLLSLSQAPLQMI